MSLQYIQKNSPGLLHTPAKFEKNLPTITKVIRKTKRGAVGDRFPPIYKQTSLAGRLILKECLLPVNSEKFGMLKNRCFSCWLS